MTSETKYSPTRIQYQITAAVVNASSTHSFPPLLRSSHNMDGGDVTLQYYVDINEMDGPHACPQIKGLNTFVVVAIESGVIRAWCC